MILDAHVHASPTWFEPVETLIGQMDRCGVSGALLTALLGQRDNSYLFDSVARFPGRFGVIAGVHAGMIAPRPHLEELAARGALGIRLRAASRSPGDDPLGIWRAAASLGLPVSVVGRWQDLTSGEFAELLEALPRLVVVLEHLGGAPKPDATPEDAAGRTHVFALARYPGVHIKVPGLAEFAQRGAPDGTDPFARPVPDYLKRVHALFGAERMMWGSDFPPVAAREGYANALSWPRKELSGVSGAELALIFGGTAARVFGVAITP